MPLGRHENRRNLSKTVRMKAGKRKADVLTLAGRGADEKIQ